MVDQSTRGRQIEIVFGDADRVLDVELDADDSAVATVVIEVLERDDPDDAERILRGSGTVRRRP